MKTDAEAEKAIVALDGTDLNGKVLRHLFTHPFFAGQINFR